MCSNPSGVHTRPVGESEKTSSGVVVVLPQPAMYLSLSLSLWHLSVLQINPTQRVSCNTLYTPTRIIQKKKWFLLRTPKWLSQKKKHFKPSRFTDFAAAVLVDDMLRSWGISGWKMREGFLKKAAAKTMSRCLKKRLAP